VQTVDGIGARDLRHERAVDAGGRVTVMLAGEQPAALARVRTGLERDGFDVVAEVVNAKQALRAARQFQPQLCLLDADLPGGGIVAADRISLELPDTRIAVLSGAPQYDQLRDALLAGADGYLPSATAPDRLITALTGLIKGEAALPRAMTGQLVREYRQFAAGHTEGSTQLRSIALDDDQSLPPHSRLFYVPRLLRHYRRRRHSGMTLGHSWASARARMDDYS
jgi:DNA-binding NarL/FixJ family response regulator